MSITQRQLFLSHLAQTTDFPLSLEIEKAEGLYMYSADGKRYMDLISGISVSNVGHCHPQVIKAVKDQADRYLHLMVYGEYIQGPQVKLAQKLAFLLGQGLSSVYFVNSGSEANEGAIKLAKRYTGRSEIISFKNAYHGSTQGALSVIGDESFKRAFRPLIPGGRTLDFNNFEHLKEISSKTAAVIAEPVQGEAGYIPAQEGYLQALAKKCKETGTLLIFDEIQTGFGRTGKLFAHQYYNVKPDIITLAKGMGGGMPIGAFISSPEIMASLKENPLLGHITTFGGHPVSCAAALACVNIIDQEKLHKKVKAKEALFRKLLVHPKIKAVRGQGLMLAVQLSSFEEVEKVIQHCLNKGIVTDWFLFCNSALRLSPPLIINEEEILLACKTIIKGLELL